MCMFLRLERRYVWQNFHKLRWKRGEERCLHLRISLLIDLFCLGHLLLLEKTNSSSEEVREKEKIGEAKKNKH